MTLAGSYIEDGRDYGFIAGWVRGSPGDIGGVIPTVRAVNGAADAAMGFRFVGVPPIAKRVVISTMWEKYAITSNTQFVALGLGYGPTGLSSCAEAHYVIRAPDSHHFRFLASEYVPFDMTNPNYFARTQTDLALGNGYYHESNFVGKNITHEYNHARLEALSNAKNLFLFVASNLARTDSYFQFSFQMELSVESRNRAGFSFNAEG